MTALPSPLRAPAHRPKHIGGLLLVWTLVLMGHLWMLGGLHFHFAISSNEKPQFAGRIVIPPSPPKEERPRPAEPSLQNPEKSISSPVAAAPDVPTPGPIDQEVSTSLELPSPATSAETAATAATETSSIDPQETAGPTESPDEKPWRFAFPPSIRLRYDVLAKINGETNTVGAVIDWKHDGSVYQASLKITKMLFNIRQWSSKGSLDETGLAPLRFGDSGMRRSEVATHFVRSEGKIIFSANTPEFPLLPGTQDNLSVFFQLASLWAGEPHRFPPDSRVSFQTAGPRQVESWTFLVSPEERIALPGGTFQAVKLTRETYGVYSTKAEIWLVPQMAYLPLQIRLTETNGNVLDMVWTDSQSL